MNKKQILIFSLILFLLSIFSIILLTLPVFSKLGSATNASIGSTIGGITAPLIGIVSSILLYLALTKQVESNNDQKLKNESDIIFLLLNQLDTEINMFYYTFAETTYSENNEKVRTEYRFNGIEALNEFSRRFDNNSKSLNYTFKAFYQSNMLLLIISSFNLVQKRIEISPIREDLKSLFYEKLDIYYCKILHNPLKKLHDAFEANPKIKDGTTDEIQAFLRLKSL